MRRVKDRSGARQVAMMWPYLPEYRLAFCHAAHERLADEGLTLTVYTGRPSTRQQMRGDEVTAHWHQLVPERRMALPGGKEMIWRGLPRHADLLILEQAVKNVETYPALLGQHLGGPGVGFFGHGRTYSSKQGPAAAAWKNFMTRRAEWAFVYTDSGVRHLVDHGVPRTRITVLHNTIDVSALQRDLAAVTKEQVAAFHRRLGTVPGRTVLFLGALDPSKGIDQVIAAAQAAAERLPGCVVVIAGEGPERPTVQAAQAAGAPVRILGRVAGSQKAVAMRAADLMLAPRCVGLVAVDSLAAERPMITVADALHGPEADYLIDGMNSRWLPGGARAEALGRALADLLTSDTEVQRLRQGCQASAADLHLEAMVNRFVGGVLAWAEIRRFGL